MATLDTQGIAHTLTDASADPKLADVTTAVVRKAADHGDHVTSDQFTARLGRAPRRSDAAYAGPSPAWSSRPSDSHDIRRR